MAGHIAAISLRQVSTLKGAGLDVRVSSSCVYRILTNNWAEVETLHRIVPDLDHSPYFVNGNFRIYVAMLTRP